MGLLDYTDDPQTQGLLSLGLRLMSTPGKFGQAFGQAGQGALADMARVKAANQESKQAGLRDQLLQMQIAQAQQQQAQQAKLRELAQQSFRSPDQVAMAANGGPTVAAAEAAKTAPAGFDFNAYAQGLAKLGDPVAALQMQQMLKKDTTPLKVGKDEVLLDPQSRKPIFSNVQPDQDKDLAMLATVYGKDTPEYLMAARALAQKRTTHQPATSVTLTTEKGYAGHMAQGLATQDLAMIDAARSAPERIRSSQEVRRILTTEKPITGTAAEQRLWVEKALSTAGLVNGRDVKSTEDLVNLLANQTLDAIKTSGLGSGQGFTDKDRQFLQDAKSGRIEINSSTLLRIANLNEAAARRSIDAGNKVAKRLKGNPNFGEIGQDLEVSPPEEFRMPTPAEVAAEARRRGLK